MRILIIIPKDIQPTVLQVALANLDLEGGTLSLDAPYSNDGGLTHTHYVACTVISDGNTPAVNQLAPNFEGLEVYEVTIDNVHDKVGELGLVSYVEDN